MLESSLVYIVARTFPESLILVLSGVILLGLNIDKKKILKLGIILGIIIGSIRLLPISFGVHTILAMTSLWYMLFKYSDKDVIKPMISTGLVWISLVLSEGIYVLIATTFMGINIESLMDNSSLQGAILTLPSLIIMFLIVILLRYIKNSVVRFKIRG